VASAPPASERVAHGARRLGRAWRALAAEQRQVSAAAIGLFATMLLPWYRASFPTRDRAYSAISAFSWVEAAVLVIVLGVLALMFARAERRAFHLPGGDGLVVTAAGGWSFFLIAWRLFDRPDLGRGVAVGLNWGIYVGLVAAAALAYAGNRLRAAQRPEPPLFAGRPPRGEDVEVADREVRLPEERPHLADTEALGGGGGGAQPDGAEGIGGGPDAPTRRLGPRPSGR
jgi:hypothetical protein